MTSTMEVPRFPMPHRISWCRSIKIYARTKWDSFLSLIDVMGSGLFFFIVIVHHCLKGFLFGGGARGVVGLPIIFLLQSYTGAAQLKAIQIQVYTTVALTPWALKSLFGMLTDIIYIGGYNKTPYLFVVVLAAAISCLVLPSMWPIEPQIVTCLLFFMFLGCALPDLLTEAKYSEKVAMNPTYSTTIVNFVWIGMFIGQILSTVLVGNLLDYMAPQWFYYIPVLPLLLMLYPIYNNWMGDKMHINTKDDNDDEPRAVARNRPHSQHLEYVSNCCGNAGWFHVHSDESGSDSDIGPIYTSSGAPLPLPQLKNEIHIIHPFILTPLIGINIEKIKREWRPFLLALLIGLISITTSVMGIIQVDPLYLCIVSVAGTIGMVIAFNMLVDKTTARIQTFVMVQNMFTVSISSAEFFFFTDTAEQYPEGPHFSKKFYVTVMGVVASVCFIVGSIIYQQCMTHWRYRSVFLFNNVVYMVVGLLNVVLYKRWNLALGIPDSFFVLGSEVFQVVVGAWTSLPVTVMMSQLCPKGMEATMFAILAGSSNLGSSLAQYVGAYVLEYLHINPSGSVGESSQFENLWVASLIATLLPGVTLILIPMLIPDKYQTEDLLEVYEDDRIERSREQLGTAISDSGGGGGDGKEYYVDDENKIDRFISDNDSDDMFDFNEDDMSNHLSSDSEGMLL